MSERNYRIGEIFYEDNDYTNRAIFCNENGLVIEEIEADKNGRRFKIVEPTISEEALKSFRVQELKNNLEKTDYIVTKLAEMQLMNDVNFTSEFNRYQDVINNRVLWRSEINSLLNK